MSLRVVLALALGLAAVTSASAAGGTHTSKRFHYSLPVPAGFALRQATTDLTPGTFPSAGSSDLDSFIKGAITIGVASTTLDTHTSTASWANARIAAIARQYNCVKPTRHKRRIGGEPAVELMYPECFGFFDTLEMVHGGRGYDVYWLGPSTSEKRAAARFHSAVAAFAFTR